MDATGTFTARTVTETLAAIQAVPVAVRTCHHTASALRPITGRLSARRN